MTDLSHPATEEHASPWFDLDAYVSLPRLGALSLSPDGETLVCSVQGVTADRTEYASALWRVDPHGERAATRYTRSVQGESAAGFLPDGSLLFTSKRDVPAVGEDEPKKSTTALWCLPANGGEAYVLARRDGGWGDVLTSPLSDTVVLGVLMHAGVEDEEADAAKREARSKRKISAILHDGYPVRFWDKDLGPETTRLRAATVGGDGDRSLEGLRDLTGDVGRSVREAVLSRDGAALAVVWGVPRRAGETMSQLELIDVARGQRRTLAADDEHEYGSPVFTDDGAHVACVRTARSTAERAPRPTLWLIDVASGEGHEVAGGWDRWATPVAFSPDGRTMYATADDDGACPVFAIDVASGEVRRLTGDGSHSSVLRSPDGTTLYALRASYASPGEIVAVDAVSGAATVLRAPVEYPPLPGRLERVETEASDGTRVPGWLILPEGASPAQPAPLTLWVHGGPLNSWNSWSWRWCPWLLVSRGQAVLLPDPALSTGYGQSYIQRGWGRWGAEPFTDVMALTDAAEARDDIRSDASVMMGGSFGGYMANWIATQTDRFTAIVSHASLWNLGNFGPTTDAAWYWKREMTPEMQAKFSPHQFAAQITTPMLVIHGDKDYRVPIGEGLALWWALASAFDGDPADLPHRFLYFPNENHWILTPQHAKVWYDTVLEFVAARREGRAMGAVENL
ncbi:S9 family peptidase [Tessaracoccus sp. MC1865]|uniref:prolyl oligopeptidase family serine peptidase n=1 Tax=Tessaracoccus sp. MC1865 TaxID=2760310 RepID=UPI0016004083|nr:prolyl oligopeptidase family serine peptidase [Tessaracoccus sp. MC1865]MBB1483554.1 S9 family peptidase [Tessaracoccus sp. MC1865]QTO36641.1 S9 family peptidase [Tessaracoccus sp. MC1865]